jgi:hypothetical protein
MKVGKRPSSRPNRNYRRKELFLLLLYSFGPTEISVVVHLIEFENFCLPPTTKNSPPLRAALKFV